MTKLHPIRVGGHDRLRGQIEDHLSALGGKPLAILQDGPLTYDEARDGSDRLMARLRAEGIVPGDRVALFCTNERRQILLVVAALRAGIAFVVGDRQTSRIEAESLLAVCRPAAVLTDADAIVGMGLDQTQPGLRVLRVDGWDGEERGTAERRAAEGATMEGGTAKGRTAEGRTAESGTTERATPEGGKAQGRALESNPPESNAASNRAVDGPALEHGSPALGGSHPETSMLIFTSGTTSSAKAVELTYDNLLGQLDIFADAYGFDADTRLLNLLPLHHTDGLTRGPISALWFGATLVRPFPFSVQAVPPMLDRVAADGVTHLIAVPTILRIIERVGRERQDALRTPAFRFVLCSADYLDAGLWTRFEDSFGVPVVNAYGLSEVVCDALFAGPEDATRIPGTIGRPVGVTARVVAEDGTPVPPGETGELVLIGPTVMRGYFGAPDLTAEVLKDGAFRTGDLVRVTESGVYDFVGRRKTVIVSGGATIHPEGVTAILSTMPGLAEAYAFGRPDPERGERLVAAVAPVPGTSLSVEQVWAFCRANLSPERVPVEIHVLGRLPRTASGKVIRSELMNTAAPEAEAEAAGSPASVYAVAARALRLNPDALNRDSSPFNTPGWDSLAHVKLITEIESAFGLTFSAGDVMDFVNLGDAEDIVSRAQPQ
ncbi:AMP-binding protein [Paracoccus sp. Z118]|uniref:AMP-binding protein n=1 Tax=Paracoccus sp. Z118 TaxID=2851017 RepID=UPI001C2CA7CE|nr:AMP-binding protein [Paracoccus sp. Z118]MBV0892995.1 AMP-binding protein [Paracoccus sp. Z118]